jgi:hypothetical protein
MSSGESGGGDRGQRNREHRVEVGVQALLYLGAGTVHHAAVPPLKGPRTVALLCFGGTILSATCAGVSVCVCSAFALRANCSAEIRL